MRGLTVRAARGSGLAASALAGATLLAATVAGAASAPIGALSQLSGKAGCVYSGGTDDARVPKQCTRGAALASASAVAISRDGRNVYVAASGEDAVSAFARNRKTGRLQPLPAKAACITAAAANPRCAEGRALFGVSSLAVSRDGRSVYALAPTYGVAVLQRDPKTGKLSQRQGVLGCLGNSTAADDECTIGTGMDDPAALALSPDGRNVYVASTSANSVAVFARNPKTGQLTQLAGALGCVDAPAANDPTVTADDPCAGALALDAPGAVEVSPDGKNVYVASDGEVAVFARSPSNGALTQLPAQGGCLASAELIDPQLNEPLPCAEGRALGVPTALGISADGRTVIVSTWPLITADSDQNSGVAVLRRDPATGVLTQPAGPGGCITELGGDCLAGRGLKTDPAVEYNSHDLALSPDSRTLYVTTVVSGVATGTISIFARAADGSFRQLAAKAGCIGAAADGCATARGLQGATGIALSSDGRDAYAATYFDNTVVAFARSRGK